MASAGSARLGFLGSGNKFTKCFAAGARPDFDILIDKILSLLYPFRAAGWSGRAFHHTGRWGRFFKKGFSE